MKNKLMVAVIAAAMAAGLAGCGIGGDKVNEPFKDAPRTAKADNGAGQIIEEPDGFSNLATKCVGGVRYTVAYHGDKPYGAISVVGGDNGCSK